MARRRDETKRNAILLAAKRLFARKGFHNTSVADIKVETGLPVGSIYTYFSGKDEIMSAIIAEGWEELHGRLLHAFENARDTESKIRVLTDEFFPELLKDLDLINILLTEAFDLTMISDKLDAVIGLIIQLQVSSAEANGKRVVSQEITSDMRTAVIVYFLGMMNAARLIRSGGLGIGLEDIRRFMYGIIAAGLSPVESKS